MHSWLKFARRRVAWPGRAAYITAKFGVRFHLAIGVEIGRLMVAEQQPLCFQNDHENRDFKYSQSCKCLPGQRTQGA